MLIGWSKHQVSDDPLQPASYMLDAAVEKNFVDGRGLEVRTPVPELLLGHTAVFQAALNIAKTALRYRVATMSFAVGDIDVDAFNSGDAAARYAVSVAIDLFLEMTFAGIPPQNRPPVLVGTHTHTGRLEINLAVPRYVTNLSGKVRSFNPHPPQTGSKIFWDAFGDHLNGTFGWADPRADQRTVPIKGPDWAEKRVAVADRIRQKFDPEMNPRLFLLQSAKILAKQHQGQNPAVFWEKFGAAIRLTKYRTTPDEKGRLWLRSDDGEPLLLKGKLINSAISHSVDPVQPQIKRDICHLWQRRANQHSEVFSRGVWDEPVPIWTARKTAPEIELPAYHPNYDPPAAGTEKLRFGSLNARLFAALRAVRKTIALNVSALMVRRGLASLQPNFFTKIRKQLEKIENDYPGTTNVQNDDPDDGSMRPTAESLGEGSRNRHRRTHRGDDGRSERDQGVDGTLYQGDGGSGSGNGRAAVVERDPRRDEGTTRGSGREYEVVPSANEPTAFSRLTLLGSMRRAADRTYPEDEVNIGMDVDGCFRISLPTGRILISYEGNVTGVHGISESEVTDFVSALPKNVTCYLTVPDGEDSPELF